MVSAFADALNSLRFAEAAPRVLTLARGVGMRKIKPARVHLYVILQGEVEIRVAESRHRLRVQDGNFLFVPSGVSHLVVADPEARTAGIPFDDADSFGDGDENDELPECAIGVGDPVVRMVDVAIVMDEVRRKLVLRMLPEARYRPADGPLVSPLSPLTSIAGIEAATQGAGAAALVRQLAQMLFVATVREALVRRDALDLRAQTPHAAQVSRALRLLRDDLTRDWTVASLARAVGMSRAAFAAAFRSEVDEAPIKYLIELRLLRADRLIRDGRYSLPEIANLVGYQSETSFIRAFKRYFGHPPGRHRACLSSPRA